MNKNKRDSRSFNDIMSYWSVKDDKIQQKPTPPTNTLQPHPQPPQPIEEIQQQEIKNNNENIKYIGVVGENKEIQSTVAYVDGNALFKSEINASYIAVNDTNSEANNAINTYEDGRILSSSVDTSSGYENDSQQQQQQSQANNSGYNSSVAGYTNNSISSYASGYTTNSEGGQSYLSYSNNSSYNANIKADVYFSTGNSFYSANSENGLDYIYNPNIDVLQVGSLEDLSNLDAKENNLNWNENFQNLLDLPESEEKYKKLSNMANDYCYCADTFGKIIISELHLPEESKTIKPLALGGVAGGVKYKCQDIIFKFVVDTELMEGLWMYGNYKRSDEYAQKSANHEIKGLNHFMDISEGLIRFPLMAIIDYRGYRLLAISCLPISKNSIVYGSNDAGKTVHNSNPEVFKEMERIGKILNLKGHEVGLNKTFLYGPGDIEIHKGFDGRFYMIDFARCFPPEYPLTFNNNKEKSGKIGREIFYSMLRPEFLRLYPEPLSSDGFSGWQCGANADEELNKPLIVATEHLHSKVIPHCINIIENRIETSIRPKFENEDFIDRVAQDNSWAEDNNTPTDDNVDEDQYFLNLNPSNYISTSPIKDYSTKIYEIKKLINYIHAKGINLRYLGLIVRNLKNRVIKQIFLTEVVGRVWKRIIRSRLRQIMDLTKRPSEEPYKTMIAEIFNLILNVNTSTHREFWSTCTPGNFKYIALAIFPRCLSESDVSSHVDLRAIIDCRLLVIRIIEMLNIRINSAAYTQFLSDPRYVITSKDIEEVGSTIKYPTIIDFASGSVLLYETQNVIRTTLAVPKEINRWIDSAQAKLSKALSSMPLSFKLTLKLATTYLFRSNVTYDFHEAIKQLNQAVVMINLASSHQRNHPLLLGLLGMVHLKLGSIYLYYTRNWKQYQIELDLARDRLLEAFEKDPNAIDEYIVQSFPITTDSGGKYMCPATKFNHSRKVSELFCAVFILSALDKSHPLHGYLRQYFQSVVNIENVEVPPSLQRIMDHSIVTNLIEVVDKMKSVKFSKISLTSAGLENITKMSDLTSFTMGQQVFLRTGKDIPVGSITDMNSFFKTLLTNCKNLETLKISSRGVEDTSFEGIYELFVNIKQLQFCDTYVTDKTLLGIAPYAQSLKSLELLSSYDIKDQGVCAILNSNKDLVELDLSYVGKLTDITGNTIKSTQTKLQLLGLVRCNFSPEVLADIIRELKDIEHLEISSTKADLMTLEALESHGATQLKHLSMRQTSVTESENSFEILANMNLKLRILELPRSPIDYSVVWNLLKRIPDLERLKTPDQFHVPSFMEKFEDHNIREDYERPLYNLKSLDLMLATISISSLQKLIELMPLVNNISLSAVTLVDENCYVVQLDDTVMTQLAPILYNIKFLDLSNLPIHKRGIACLIKACPSLVTLTLLNCKGVTEQDKYDASVLYPHIQFS